MNEPQSGCGLRSIGEAWGVGGVRTGSGSDRIRNSTCAIMSELYSYQSCFLIPSLSLRVLTLWPATPFFNQSGIDEWNTRC